MTALDTEPRCDPVADGPQTTTRESHSDIRFVSRALANGVAVLTVLADGTPRGMTVSAFAPVSFDPPLIMVAVNRFGHTHHAIQRAGGFGLSVLSADQQTIARHFASRRRPAGTAQFAHIPHRTSPTTGCPLLNGAVARFDCLTEQLTPAGDHVLLIGDVINAEGTPDLSPLLHINSTYRSSMSPPT